MSSLQKLLVALLPRKWAKNMEVKSRAWMTRCRCGFERSLWEAGGIRWIGRGKERLYLSCPRCGQFRWHTVYKKPN